MKYFKQTSSPTVQWQPISCRVMSQPAWLIQTFLLLPQAHPHLPGLLPGLCLLRLLRCCDRGPGARPRHHVLAQREVGLYRCALRLLTLRPQEVDHQGDVTRREFSAPQLRRRRAARPTAMLPPLEGVHLSDTWKEEPFPPLDGILMSLLNVQS